MTWHREFPTDANEMWAILAKVLMIRAGGSVTISKEELRDAAECQSEIELYRDGSINFRIERH